MSSLADLATDLVIVRPENGWPDDKVIWTSGEQSNNNDLNSVQVLVEYQKFTPNSDNVKTPWAIFAVIQEEIANGRWVDVASAGETINNPSDNPCRMMILSPHPNFNPGADEIIGEKTQVTRIESPPLSKYRVQIRGRQIEPAGEEPALEELQVSVFTKVYDS